MITRTKFLIVGGGVSGLMFANLVPNRDYLVVEKEPELGGYCRTIYQDGFTWDYAGHFFHFANEDIKNFFTSKIPESSFVVKEKNTKIFCNGRVIDFPFQANIHQLSKETFINCLYDLYFKEEKEDYESFLEMLYGKFGKSITELFLKPYNQKLYACDLNSLDKNAMGRFFPHANFEQIVRNFKGGYEGSYNNTFLYPKYGAKIFVDALAEALPQKNILLEEQVLHIDRNLKIVTTNKRKIKYQYLITSMPLNLLLDCLDSDEYYDFSKRLSWNKVLVLNLGFDKASRFNELHWAYFPESEFVFYRVGFYNNILNQERLSIYAEIGFGKDKCITIDKQLKETLAGLRKARIIDDHELISWASVVMDPAYVHIDSRLAERKARIQNSLKLNQIYSIGRYGDWKYCSIEDSMLDAVSVAKSLSIV